MLTGQYAVNFLQGIQFGEDPKHTQIVGTCKHFVANSMEHWCAVWGKLHEEAPLLPPGVYLMSPFIFLGGLQVQLLPPQLRREGGQG